MFRSLKPHNIPPYLNKEILKKLCFINNLRAKFFTIAIVCYAIFISTYDVVFNQRLLSRQDFLLQFKLDIILIVFSVIFTIYIYFNQVKSAKYIKKYHQVIHTTISFFILCWSAMKACNSSFSSEILIQIYIISAFIVSIVFFFPFYSYIFQLLGSILFYIFIALYFQIDINEVFYLGIFNLGLLMLAFLVSRLLFHQKVEYFLKEYELFRLKDEKLFLNGGKKETG